MDNQNININPEPKKLFGPKLIFIILGIILVVELFFAARILTRPLPPPPQKLQPLTNAKIVLISPKTTYTKGETVPVTVRVTTGGRNTSGTDLILRYDPKILEASTSGIRRGTIYQEYPLISLTSKGEIRISGISTDGGFNGIGMFANIIFKTIGSGQTSVKVDFQKDSTTDSNVVETGTTKDILDQVFNVDLTIR